MGEPVADREEQVELVLERLGEAYPEATISLEYTDRLELLVAVILSAQCTDERVNQVTADLFEKYTDVEDYATVDQDELAEDIGSITYFNQKAGWLREAAQQLVEEHEGEVPATMEALTELPGVGRKTANVVLQHGHDVVEGIVVDTHVMRLSRRLGLTERSSREAIERDLMSVVPGSAWNQYTHRLIAHGRSTCTARNPDCEECVLEDSCPSSRLDSEIDLAAEQPWED
ncbi:MAG: endonuclease III [Halobacteriales archaeon]